MEGDEGRTTMHKHRAFGLTLLLAGFFLWTGCNSSGSSASAQTGFSLASIKGSYGFSFSVAVPGTNTVDFIGGTGVYHSDGAGHLSGTESYNSTNNGGHSCTNVAISGTYAVNPDGTGTDTLNLSSSDPECTGSFDQSLVIADGGKIVKATNIQPGAVLVAGDWTRQ
jgi:hypothetical protein